MAGNLANVIGASIGGCVGIVIAGALASALPKPYALALGAIVTGVMTDIVSIGATASLRLTRWGRFWIDHRSAYEGRWLEDFEGNNPDRPYTILDLTFQPGRGCYSGNAKTYDENGKPMGLIGAPDILVRCDGLTLAYRYEAMVSSKDNKKLESMGFGELIFQVSSPSCRAGSGKIFGRGDVLGEVHFKLQRVDAAFLKKLGFKRGAEDPEVVRAYHRNNNVTTTP